MPEDELVATRKHDRPISARDMRADDFDIRAIRQSKVMVDRTGQSAVFDPDTLLVAGLYSDPFREMNPVLASGRTERRRVQILDRQVPDRSAIAKFQ